MCEGGERLYLPARKRGIKSIVHFPLLYPVKSHRGNQRKPESTAADQVKDKPPPGNRSLVRYIRKHGDGSWYGSHDHTARATIVEGCDAVTVIFNLWVVALLGSPGIQMVFRCVCCCVCLCVLAEKKTAGKKPTSDTSILPRAGSESGANSMWL